MHISPREVNLVTAWALAVTTELHEVAADDGLNPATQAALCTLFNRPGESIEFLRGILGLSHPGCVRLVDRLEQEGLAQRRPGEDGRTLSLSLTAEGKRRARGLHRRREAVIARSLAGLSAAEGDQLRALLETMLRAGAPADEVAADRRCRLCLHRGCFSDGLVCPVDLGFADRSAAQG
jgi:DNA-binding MarR family transcriptional regulator